MVSLEIEQKEEERKMTNEMKSGKSEVTIEDIHKITYRDTWKISKDLLKPLIKDIKTLDNQAREENMQKIKHRIIQTYRFYDTNNEELATWTTYGKYTISEAIQILKNIEKGEMITYNMKNKFHKDTQFQQLKDGTLQRIDGNIKIIKT